MGVSKFTLDRYDFSQPFENETKEPYYSISLKDSHGGNNVWGGDPAWADCYDKELAQEIFKEWDGTLYYSGDKYGYRIEP